jgi:hypothetical protein
MRQMAVPVSVTGLPVGGRPRKSPRCSPRDDGPALFDRQEWPSCARLAAAMHRRTVSLTRW